MDREFKPIQRFQEPSNNHSRLFESVFPNSFPAPTENSPITRDSRGRGAPVPASEVPADNSENARINRINRVDPSFVPTSVDLDEFLDNDFAGSSLSRKDLDQIAQQALTAGKTRKQQLVDQLYARFDDVNQLSDNGYGNSQRITKTDLMLYSGLLSHREKHPGGANNDISAWKRLHYDIEINNSAYPQFGFLTGGLAGIPIRNMIMRIPQFDGHMAALKTANPRAAATALASFTGLTLVSSAFGGKGLGEIINRSLNPGGINKHFYDQAAPAMKRLLER